MPIRVNQPVLLPLQPAQGPRRRHLPNRPRSAGEQDPTRVQAVLVGNEARPGEDRGSHVAGAHWPARQSPPQPHRTQPLHHVCGFDPAGSGSVVGRDRGHLPSEQPAAHAESAPAVRRVAETVPQPVPAGVRRVDNSVGRQQGAADGVAGFQVDGMHPKTVRRLFDLQIVPRPRNQRPPGRQAGHRGAGHPLQHTGNVVEPQPQAVVGGDAPQHEPTLPVGRPPVARRERGDGVAGVQQRHCVRRRERSHCAPCLSIQHRKAVSGCGDHLPARVAERRRPPVQAFRAGTRGGEVVVEPAGPQPDLAARYDVRSQRADDTSGSVSVICVVQRQLQRGRSRKLRYWQTPASPAPAQAEDVVRYVHILGAPDTVAGPVHPGLPAQLGSG